MGAWLLTLGGQRRWPSALPECSQCPHSCQLDVDCFEQQWPEYAALKFVMWPLQLEFPPLPHCRGCTDRRSAGVRPLNWCTQSQRHLEAASQPRTASSGVVVVCHQCPVPMPELNALRPTADPIETGRCPFASGQRYTQPLALGGARRMDHCCGQAFGAQCFLSSQSCYRLVAGYLPVQQVLCPLGCFSRAGPAWQGLQTRKQPYWSLWTTHSA